MLTGDRFQACHRPYWRHVQLDPHQRKPGLSHIERIFHPDAEGVSSNTPHPRFREKTLADILPRPPQLSPSSSPPGLSESRPPI